MATNVTLIIGLGNPGKDYERTRHNAGFMVVDAFAKAKGLSWKHEPTLRSTISEGNIDGKKVLLMKATTYMNASGEAVRMVMDRFHITAESTIVVSDDVALALGTLRVRSEGGAGGHNGLKSIIQHIGSQTFWRIKVGVNPPPENIALETYVLNRFMKEEHGVIDRSVAKAVEILSTIPESLKTTTYTV